MRFHVLLCCLCLLSACGDWPDAGGPPLERQSTDWPDLLPISTLMTGGTVPIAEEDEARALAARAAALRARARILRSDASDIDAMEALRARMR